MYSVSVFCVSQFLFFFSLSLVLYCIYCMHEYDALLYERNKGKKGLTSKLAQNLVVL